MCFVAQLELMILQLHRESQKVYLKMNIKNTKVMFNNNILDHECKMKQ